MSEVYLLGVGFGLASMLGMALVPAPKLSTPQALVLGSCVFALVCFAFAWGASK